MARAMLYARCYDRGGRWISFRTLTATAGCRSNASVLGRVPRTGPMLLLTLGLGGVSGSPHPVPPTSDSCITRVYWVFPVLLILPTSLRWFCGGVVPPPHHSSLNLNSRLQRHSQCDPVARPPFCEFLPPRAWQISLHSRFAAISRPLPTPCAGRPFAPLPATRRPLLEVFEHIRCPDSSATKFFYAP